MMTEQNVILVDESDQELGTAEKMEAHRLGLLHRAFSVFVFDGKGRMLLQQRAAHKYHGGLLWTNTCCSHPFPGERVGHAAQRRLAEELGFSTELKKIFHFTYKASVENGLTEHEFDHVFTGIYEGAVYPAKDEVADYCYQEMEEINRALIEHPAKFTSWFRIAFPKVEAWWKEGQTEKMM